MEPKAAEWKKEVEKPMELVLPACGRTIKLRKVTMGSLVRKGVIPTHLYRLATGQQKEVAHEDLTPEHFKNLVELMAVYATVAAVEPKIVNTDEVPEDAIHVDMLEDDDLTAIFMASKAKSGGKPSRELKSFPGESEGAPDRPVGDEVSPAAVEPAGPCGPVGSPGP